MILISEHVDQAFCIICALRELHVYINSGTHNVVVPSYIVDNLQGMSQIIIVIVIIMIIMIMIIKIMIIINMIIMIMIIVIVIVIIIIIIIIAIIFFRIGKQYMLIYRRLLLNKIE